MLTMLKEKSRTVAGAVGACALLLGVPALVAAQEGGGAVGGVVVQDSNFALNTLIMFFCAVFVLFMQAGFAMVEAGFNAAKNTVNILFKNLMDLTIGVIIFYLVGYGIMYGGGMLIGDLSADATVSPQVDFLYQVAFAATAATIVSGAVAGRLKFISYLIYTTLITGIIYPISGAWTWGGGWLSEMGFHDFAGSGIVHAVGGFAGLAGALVLGPRIGKFTNGKVTPTPGHNIFLATLGVFILWIGWYGFNPGSQLAYATAADAHAVALIAVNTTLAAAAGALVAMIISWWQGKKPDLITSLNGALAGLVAITANCDVVTNQQSLIIGAIGGILLVGGTYLLDMLKIDDTVGAWPVHGLCGMWGVIATGIFGGAALGVQILGAVTLSAWAFVTMFILFFVLKKLNLLRVSAEEEKKGLDFSEHGVEPTPTL